MRSLLHTTLRHHVSKNKSHPECLNRCYGNLWIGRGGLHAWPYRLPDFIHDYCCKFYLSLLFKDGAAAMHDKHTKNKRFSF
jgi:hypothetical protein